MELNFSQKEAGGPPDPDDCVGMVGPPEENALNS
jgi:hypothetical protein